MKFNKFLEFQAKLHLPSAQRGTAPSLEDDIITENMKHKQQSTAMQRSQARFKLSLIPVTCYEIHHNFVYTCTQQGVVSGLDKSNREGRSFSFVTADSSFEKRTGNNFNNVNRISTRERSQKTSEKRTNTSPLLSPTTARAKARRRSKLKEGLISLASLVHKVECKALAFRFTHIKIFSQLKALEVKKAQKSNNGLNSPRLPNNSKDFYRQWFKRRYSDYYAKRKTKINNDTTVCI